MRTVRPLFPCLLWILISSTSAATAGEVALRLTAGIPADDITVERDGDTWSIQHDRHTTALDLPAEARPERLVEADDGLWLTATRATDAGEVLHILRVVDGQAETLPLPDLATGGVIVRPTPVATDTGVAGMLWFEGSRMERTALRWASWQDGAWSAPHTLSATGPGTQTALSVTTLADGSWLATWSAFDGDDDEIVWSHFVDGSWSQPSALSTNAVPDITPKLRSLGDGAMVAWSGFDGRDYRIHIARFDAGTWSPARVLEGRGASRPEFANLEAPLVVYRQTVPPRWALVELGADGTPQRRALAEPGPRPRVISVLNEGLRVVDPSRSTAPKDPKVLAWTPPRGER